MIADLTELLTTGMGLILSLGMILLNLIASWRLFEKAGLQGWKGLIPIYNTYCLYQMAFGKGKGIYLSDFQTNPQNTRLLLRLICQNVEEQSLGPDNLWTECSYFPESNKLVWINNSEIQQRAVVKVSDRDFAETLMPGELKVQEVGNLA